MNFIIIGDGRHGKDQLAEYLSEVAYVEFSSSSEAALDIFLYNELKDFYGYESKEECFADRVTKRDVWRSGIDEFNKEDPAKLAKIIMETNDIYVGMRSFREFSRCLEIGLFDHVIHVDAFDRLGFREPTNELGEDLATIRIKNNSSKGALRRKAKRLARTLKLKIKH